MSNPLIASKFLTVYPEAQRLHEIGLVAELGGNYPEAHESFGEAKQILEGQETLEAQVQTARVSRDEGFTWVREALAGSDSSLLDGADAEFSSSLALTAHFLKGTAIAITRRLPKGYDLSANEIRKEVSSEHGATLGLMGRLVTVKAVMTGNDLRSESVISKASSAELRPYSQAHIFLRQGDNGYYLVSNAINAARHERLSGRADTAAIWVGRAASGTAWSALNDPANLGNVSLTFGSRVRYSSHYLSKYETALHSVLVKP